MPLAHRQLVPMFAAGLLALAAGCDSPWEPVIAEPTIVGRITAMDTVRTFRILVEENPSVSEPLDAGGGKFWFSVWEQTPVFDARGGRAVLAGREILAVGQRAAVVTHGVVLTSYPAQAGADTVVIVD